MMKNTPLIERTRGLFTFALLSVYALCACLMLMAGVQVYRSVSARTGQNYDSRTVLAYISGKLRLGYEPSVENGVLVLTDAAANDTYQTYIYCRDGALCEYSGLDERAFDPTLGQEIAAAVRFDATIEDDLLSVSVTDAQGYERSVCYRMREGGANNE